MPVSDTDPFLKRLRFAVCEKLRDELATPGLQVLEYMVAKPSPPTLWVMGAEEVDYHEESEGGARWSMMLMGITNGLWDSEAAQQILDAWQSHDGPSSVPAVLENWEPGEAPFDGLVDDVTVRGSSGVEVFVIPSLNAARVGTIFTVEFLT